jgi:hypothetical protein
MAKAKQSKILPAMGPLIDVVPISQWQRLGLPDKYYSWAWERFVGPSVVRNQERCPQWKLYCIVFIEGLRLGSQFERERASAEQLEPSEPSMGAALPSAEHVRSGSAHEIGTPAGQSKGGQNESMRSIRRCEHCGSVGESSDSDSGPTSRNVGLTQITKFQGLEIDRISGQAESLAGTGLNAEWYGYCRAEE